MIEAATFSGLAAGGITGGGNVAMQGGSAADIFAGAVGGALIGGSTSFLGSSIAMGIGNLASSIGEYRPDAWWGGNSNIHFPGAGKIINPSIGDAFNYYTRGLSGKFSTFLSSNSSTLTNIGGGLSGMGAGSLFQFAGFHQPQDAISYQEFYYHTRNLTYSEIIHQRPNQGPLGIFPGGPNLDIRYVLHPMSSRIIDMRHFLVVGYWGNIPGAVGEFGQLLSKKHRASALDFTDFYSNYLGNKFWRYGYNPKSEDPFSLQLFKWFRKRDPRFRYR